MCDVKENIQYDPQSAANSDGTTRINSKAASTEPEEKSPSQKHENVHVVVNSYRKCNWKNIITVVYLWLTYLFINANYSLIGPLFPSEVINLNILGILYMLHCRRHNFNSKV